MVLPDLACLRIAVYEDSGRLLGHRVLPVTGLCPGYRHLGLRNDGGQPLNLATLFVNIMVKGTISDMHNKQKTAINHERMKTTFMPSCLFIIDYIPDGLSDFANALANPIKYQSELEKRSKQLSILTGEIEDPMEVNHFESHLHRLSKRMWTHYIRLISFVIRCFHVSISWFYSTRLT